MALLKNITKNFFIKKKINWLLRNFFSFTNCVGLKFCSLEINFSSFGNSVNTRILFL